MVGHVFDGDFVLCGIWAGFFWLVGLGFFPFFFFLIKNSVENLPVQRTR